MNVLRMREKHDGEQENIKRGKERERKGFESGEFRGLRQNIMKTGRMKERLKQVKIERIA